MMENLHRTEPLTVDESEDRKGTKLPEKELLRESIPEDETGEDDKAMQLFFCK